MALHSVEKIEYGDFQTPIDLAESVCQFLRNDGIVPTSLLEPTCGVGSFIQAGLTAFPSLKKIVGVDINPTYIEVARENLPSVDLHVENFFTADWDRIVGTLTEPILIIGNLPWVTNATVSGINGSNLPEKSNFLNFNGFDAMTGKSNFDISEWMLIKILEWIKGRDATVAMLCKTSVARKVVVHAWNGGVELSKASIHGIDAMKYFSASVDACLLVLKTGKGDKSCFVYSDLDSQEPSSVLGFEEGRLIANIKNYRKWKHLLGQSKYRWRSGIKHDSSKVMEFRRVDNGFENGLGEIVNLEEKYLYPMLKSSDIAKGNTIPKKWMLVTQKATGKDTSIIQSEAPKTWEYLISHASYLDGRKSSLYKKAPRFSIFGIGEYSFSPYKIAVSGMYKKLHFTLLKTFEEKPIMLDDTCYFLSCDNEDEANALSTLLNSDPAKQFFDSLIFWDAKRPITVDVLKQLQIEKLIK